MKVAGLVSIPIYEPVKVNNGITQKFQKITPVDELELRITNALKSQSETTQKLIASLESKINSLTLLITLSQKPVQPIKQLSSIDILTIATESIPKTRIISAKIHPSLRPLGHVAHSRPNTSAVLETEFTASQTNKTSVTRPSTGFLSSSLYEMRKKVVTEGLALKSQRKEQQPLTLPPLENKKMSRILDDIRE